MTDELQSRNTVWPNGGTLVGVLSPSFPNSRLGTHARKLRFPNGWKPKSLTANP